MRINGKFSAKIHMDLNRGMTKPTAQPPRNSKQPNTQFVPVDSEPECHHIYRSD